MSKHHVVHYRARRAGCWCACSCGWRSLTWTTVGGSELEFGIHLVESQEETHE